MAAMPQYSFSSRIGRSGAAYLLAILGFLLWFTDIDDWLFALVPRKLFPIINTNQQYTSTDGGDSNKEKKIVSSWEYNPKSHHNNIRIKGQQQENDYDAVKDDVDVTNNIDEAIGDNKLRSIEISSSYKQCYDKERLIEILLNAGQDENVIINDDCEELPTWTEVTSLYGSQPIIYGLDSCQQYRNNIRRANNNGATLTNPDPRVDGLFNSGTNAFVDTLNLNFRHVDDRLNYNIPPGIKHVLLSNRDWYHNLTTAAASSESNPITFLPIVMIRDPYRWMISMCKAHYTASWMKGLDGRCPNLIMNDIERADKQYGNLTNTFKVTVNQSTTMAKYDSLADMWSIWYKQYYDVNATTQFPRLIIRFEDTLFHAEKVMQLVNQCLTGEKTTNATFLYHMEKSKRLKSSADFSTALKKYGRPDGRYDMLQSQDKLYALKALDPQLLKAFHYPTITAKEIQTIINNQVNNLVSMYPLACAGKEHLLQILLRSNSGTKTKTPILTQKDCNDLPTWKEVTALYGDEPVIYGLDTCQRYRDNIANTGQQSQPDPRVDGLFNSGTNAFVDILNDNFKHVQDRLDYNIPGTKHWFLNNRSWAKKNLTTTTTTDGSSGKEETPSSGVHLSFFPIVLVRDPLRWMASMCKTPYTAKWQKGLNGHCPNLVLSREEREAVFLYQDINNNKTFSVSRDAKDGNPAELYTSLADMYSKWYQAYIDADFPRLIIRFEDTLFHAERVMEIVTECVTGNKLEVPYQYHLQKSKNTKTSADFSTALAKYGRADGRYDGMTIGDIDYARTALDPNLLKMFHYPEITLKTKVLSDEMVINRKVMDLVSKFGSCKEKEQILRILLSAGMNEVGAGNCRKLPTWDEVTTLYGDEPVVYGLETCERYRSVLTTTTSTGRSVNSSSAGGQKLTKPAPRVDGLFNSGTNAFVDSLNLNFEEVEDRLIYNIPGGKHRHIWEKPWAKNVSDTNPITFLPIVLVRDPFRWMASMCKCSYTAEWQRVEGHCPNLVPSKDESLMEEYKNVETFTVTRIDKQGQRNETYDSLADYWSEFYQAYFNADFPRLIIRFEDTLFHAEKVMQLVRGCLLGTETENKPFLYHLEKSKRLKSSADFSTALAKYGKEEGRYEGLTAEDKEYAHKALDPNLLKKFHYPEYNR